MDTQTLQAISQLSGSMTLTGFLLYAWWGERKERQTWQRLALELARERSQVTPSPSSSKTAVLDE